MELFVPKLEVTDEEGFEEDLFGRSKFAETLTSVLTRHEGAIVTALTGAWGSGKSTFVRQWMPGLRKAKCKTVYFDAFKNDFQGDPFLTLAAETYRSLTPPTKRTEFKQRASKLLRGLGRGTLRVLTKAATAGVVDETVFESSGAGTELSSVLDDQVASFFDDINQAATTMAEFQEFLSSLASDGDAERTVFVVDELDRCRPDFALGLLEQIKHLYAVPGIQFVLVMNRDQMEDSVRARYGADIDGNRYLQKFVNLWLTLPEKRHRKAACTTYMTYCLDAMGYQQDPNTNASRTLKDLVPHFNLSLREVEKTLTNFAVLQGEGGRAAEVNAIGELLCVLRVRYPRVFDWLHRGENLSYSLLSERVGLDGLPGELNDEPHWLIPLLKFVLDNEDPPSRLRMNLHFGMDTLQGLCDLLTRFSPD